MYAHGSIPSFFFYSAEHASLSNGIYFVMLEFLRCLWQDEYQLWSADVRKDKYILCNVRMYTDVIHGRPTADESLSQMQQQENSGAAYWQAGRRRPPASNE